MPGGTVYLVRCSDEEAAEVAVGADGEACPLDAGLLLVDSELTRSQLYHRVKRAQPAGSPLLVAPLAEAPKMMGMASGSAAWSRARLPAASRRHDEPGAATR